MNNAFAIKILSQMRDEWRVIIPTLHPEKQADRRRKYRREVAALSWAINKGTGKT